MGKITVGNRLYFYQLLSREIGVGKQVLVPRVEEVLAADDIEAADLEFESTLDLLAAMPELIKLTVFKKGRVYATLLANDEFDGILERLAAPAPAEKGAKGGPKSWKRKKGPKDPTPAKPRKRVVEAPAELEPEAEEPEPVAEVEEAPAPEVVQTPEVDAVNEAVVEVPQDVLASEDEAADCPSSKPSELPAAKSSSADAFSKPEGASLPSSSSPCVASNSAATP